MATTLQSRYTLNRILNQHCQIYALLYGRMLRASQETVKHIARINVGSGDRIRRIVTKRDRALARTCAGARNIKCTDGALLSTHEAVIDIARVDVISRDHSRRANILGYGALAETCAGARSVEGGDSAV